MDLIRRTLARLQPVTDGHTHGNLTVHALRMASADSAIAAAPPPYLCLAQALDQGLIDIEEISESGSVASLEARNRSEQPVFLLDGEELVGAKQNRVTNASILLPARSVTRIPVSCVEAGRWAHRTRNFSRAGRTQFAAGRARRAASVSASLQAADRYDSDQSAVWEDIGLKMRRMQVDSPTAAMADIYERHAHDIDSYAAAFEPLPDQCGAVFAVGEQLVGLELFDHPATLQAYLPAIVSGYALDALECDPPRQVPAPAAARAMVDAVRQADYDVRARAVGLGQDVRLADPRLAGGALVHEARVVHLAAFRIEHDERLELRARRMQMRNRARRFQE